MDFDFIPTINDLYDDLVAYDFFVGGQRFDQCFGTLFEQTMRSGVISEKCGFTLRLLQKGDG
jgi:hypothetical protein